ncbi:MAG: hypothetical protein IPP72_03055 [Chitinophagaceae bacterium]|nr:hypothetical protein [Chitinophagaceae bacterium]
MISEYKIRPIRFLKIIEHDEWKVKLYSISCKSEKVSDESVFHAVSNLSHWLVKSKIYPLDTYKIATLIIHEWRGGCFAVINWWIDQNMLQQFVYLATNKKPTKFKLYSDRGIMTCVWELAVLWFERNAWVKHVLCKSENPDIDAYLIEQLNGDF